MKKLFSAFLSVLLIFGMVFNTHCFAETASDLFINGISVPYEIGETTYFDTTTENGEVTGISKVDNEADATFSVTDSNVLKFEILMDVNNVVHDAIESGFGYTGDKYVYLGNKKLQEGTIGGYLTFDNTGIPYTLEGTSHVQLDSNEITIDDSEPDYLKIIIEEILDGDLDTFKGRFNFDGVKELTFVDQEDENNQEGVGDIIEEDPSNLSIGGYPITYTPNNISYFKATIEDGAIINIEPSNEDNANISVRDSEILEIFVLNDDENDTLFNLIKNNFSYPGDKYLFLNDGQLQEGTIGYLLEFYGKNVPYQINGTSSFNFETNPENPVVTYADNESDAMAIIDDYDPDILTITITNKVDQPELFKETFNYKGNKELKFIVQGLPILSIENAQLLSQIGKISYFFYDDITKEIKEVATENEANIIVDLTNYVNENSFANVTLKNISVTSENFARLKFGQNANIYFDGKNDLKKVLITCTSENLSFYNNGEEIEIFGIVDAEVDGNTINFKKGSFKLNFIMTADNLKIDGAKIIIEMTEETKKILDGGMIIRPIISKGLDITSGELIIKGKDALLVGNMSIDNPENILNEFDLKIGDGLIALAGLNYDGSDLSTLELSNLFNYKYIHIYKPEPIVKPTEENSNFVKTSDETNIMMAVTTLLISGLMVLLTAYCRKSQKSEEKA